MPKLSSTTSRLFGTKHKDSHDTTDVHYTVSVRNLISLKDTVPEGSRCWVEWSAPKKKLSGKTEVANVEQSNVKWDHAEDFTIPLKKVGSSPEPLLFKCTVMIHAAAATKEHAHCQCQFKVDNLVNGKDTGFDIEYNYDSHQSKMKFVVKATWKEEGVEEPEPEPEPEPAPVVVPKEPEGPHMCPELKQKIVEYKELEKKYNALLASNKDLDLLRKELEKAKADLETTKADCQTQLAKKDGELKEKDDLLLKLYIAIAVLVALLLLCLPF